MAFSLKTQNVLATDSVALSPTGERATPYNFISPYDYATQYQPDLNPQLYMKYGKGKITGFVRLTGGEEAFASDEVKHAEQGRLHNVYEGVTVANGDEFTTAAAHTLRVNDEVLISDGTIEKSGIVSSVDSTTQVTIENKDAGAFGFANAGAGPVTISVISSSFNKGTDNFTEGLTWNPEIITNYPQIIKEFYGVAESDLAHLTWVKTPYGDGWYNYDTQRTLDLYDNKIELTHVFAKRAADTSAAAVAGLPRGMKGIIQQVEERGNIANERITSIDELSDIAYRIKRQGQCRSFTVWADHLQMAAFREMLASVNGHYANGANYGVFQNSMDMALALDFSSVKIDGVTFHFTPWALLDDPTLMGSALFNDTNIACLIVPAGESYVMESGDVAAKPYLSIRYRKKDGVNRYKKIDFFGGSIGTPHKKDTMEMLCTTEQTNQVVGANEWFVVRRGTGIYTGS